MLLGAHGGLLSHAGAFCPVHQCPNSSEATSWETAGRHIYVAPAAAAPPSPSLATKSAYGAVWHAIGRIARDLVGGVLSAWYQSELQHQLAHRRRQLPRLGVRSTGGVIFCERLLFLTLLATGAYE